MLPMEQYSKAFLQEELTLNCLVVFVIKTRLSPALFELLVKQSLDDNGSFIISLCWLTLRS